MTASAVDSRPAGARKPKSLTRRERDAERNARDADVVSAASSAVYTLAALSELAVQEFAMNRVDEYNAILLACLRSAGIDLETVIERFGRMRPGLFPVTEPERSL